MFLRRKRLFTIFDNIDWLEVLRSEGLFEVCSDFCLWLGLFGPSSHSVPFSK